MTVKCCNWVKNVAYQNALQALQHYFPQNSFNSLAGDYQELTTSFIEAFNAHIDSTAQESEEDGQPLSNADIIQTFNNVIGHNGILAELSQFYLNPNGQHMQVDPADPNSFITHPSAMDIDFILSDLEGALDQDLHTLVPGANMNIGNLQNNLQNLNISSASSENSNNSHASNLNHSTISGSLASDSSMSL